MNIAQIIDKGAELGYVFLDEEYHRVYVDPDDNSLYAELHNDEVGLKPGSMLADCIRTEFKLFPEKYIKDAIIEYLPDGHIKVTSSNFKRSIILKVEISRIVNTKDELNKIVNEIKAA